MNFRLLLRANVVKADENQAGLNRIQICRIDGALSQFRSKCRPNVSILLVSMKRKDEEENKKGEKKKEEKNEEKERKKFAKGMKNRGVCLPLS